VNAVPGDPAEGKTPAANSPIFPAPPRNGGSYTAEVISGPRGPLAIYHFGCENRSGRRLLVLKLDHYGDFLIGFPALKRLREAFPADHITLVCGSWNVNLAKESRIADEVHAYDFFPENDGKRGLVERGATRKRAAFARHLSREIRHCARSARR
jgi:hypothetical protein